MNFKPHTWLALLVAFGYPAIAQPADNQILIQSTTSTANSGLYKFLLPKFKAQTNITAHVVAVGTGQAIRNARNCDGDVLLVHAKTAEDAFVAEGYGLERHNLMYNDFILIGPSNDPAGVKAAIDVETALTNIAKTNSLFASRGDDSGTHKKELGLWQQVELNANVNDQSWYRSTGSGMGATINTAIGIGAYTISDRATWISFKNKQDFDIVFEGDSALFNQYGVIAVNPAKCPSVSHQNAVRFITWLLSDETQQTISEFKVEGQQLFYPNAKSQ
ncbi:UNVERIFIED_CONTAM: hypothetical protein GTU68_017402 [Idotea baltica]|nr:hypothetical protein [Idotea baltica]